MESATTVFESLITLYIATSPLSEIRVYHHQIGSLDTGRISDLPEVTQVSQV